MVNCRLTVTRFLISTEWFRPFSFTFMKDKRLFLSILPLGLFPMLCFADDAAKQAAEGPAPVPGLFGTLFPYLLIAALVVVAIAVSFVRTADEKTERLLTIGIPACLAVAALLEILALYSVGNKAIWWCDPDRYGFWGGFFRFIPLMLVLVGQIASIYTYQAFLSNTNAMYGQDVRISLKPAAIALVIAFPLALIVGALLQWAGLPKFLQETGLFIVLFGILIIGLGSSAKKNINQFGKKYGIAVSVFAVIYILGIIAAVWLLIVGIFQMIIQEAILVVLAYFFLFKTGILQSLIPEGQKPRGAFDNKGNWHSTKSEALRASYSNDDKK